MKRSRGVVVGSGLVATLLLGLLGAAPAEARGRLTEQQLEAQATARYWLGHGGVNMILARPLTEEVDLGRSGPAPESSGPPSPRPSAQPTTRPTTGTSNDRGLLRWLLGRLKKQPAPPDSVGRVYFLDEQGDRRWCTGVALQSKYGNLVATAGQCVGIRLDRWVFEPGSGSALGRAPHGAFVLAGVNVHHDWDVYGDHDRNYAFVTVYDGVKPKGAKQLREAGRLSDAVGGQGFAWSRPDGEVRVVGHPAGRPVGFAQRSPGDPVDRTFPIKVARLKGEELRGVRPSSPFSNSLGAGWLIKYSDAKGVGYLAGITIATSSGPGDGAISLSATFDGDTYAVYRAASDRQAGSILSPA